MLGQIGNALQLYAALGAAKGQQLPFCYAKLCQHQISSVSVMILITTDGLLACTIISSESLII